MKVRDTGGDSMEPDEIVLVRALRSSDPAAFGTLIDRYQNAVFGLCLRMMGHRQDAEDVAQESFIRAIRGIAGFDGTRPLLPWLLGIAANRCRTALGKRSRRPIPAELPEIEEEQRVREHDPDELAAELERALAKLRPDYRLVFVLFHESGLPYDEIGRSIGRPVGTVKTWLHRARAELAEHLSRRGVSLS